MSDDLMSDPVIVCPRCEEPVLPGQAHPHLLYMQNFHHECSARNVLGSVGHILGQCSCYGGTWEDPPLMTRRGAAQMALELTRLGLRPPPRKEKAP